MRNVLALLTVTVMIAVATSAALASGPTVDGTVTGIFFTNGNEPLEIAVDGAPYAIPLDFYFQVQVGNRVHFDGTNWTVVE